MKDAQRRSKLDVRSSMVPMTALRSRIFLVRIPHWVVFIAKHPLTAMRSNGRDAVDCRNSPNHLPSGRVRLIPVIRRQQLSDRTLLDDMEFV